MVQGSCLTGRILFARSAFTTALAAAPHKRHVHTQAAMDSSTGQADEDTLRATESDKRWSEHGGKKLL